MHDTCRSCAHWTWDISDSNGIKQLNEAELKGQEEELRKRGSSSF